MWETILSLVIIGTLIYFVWKEAKARYKAELENKILKRRQELENKILKRRQELDAINKELKKNKRDYDDALYSFNQSGQGTFDFKHSESQEFSTRDDQSSSSRS